MVKIDFDVEPNVYSRETVEKRWVEDWGERMAPRHKELKTMYPINQYLVAIHNDNNYKPEDKGKVIGYVAYQKMKGFAFFGDAFVRREYRKGVSGVEGVYRDLAKERNKRVPEPKISGLKPKDSPISEYLEMQQKYGNWNISPSDEFIEREFPSAFPEKTIDWFKNRYDNDPNASWGIKKYDDAFGKAWLQLMVGDFEPAGE